MQTIGDVTSATTSPGPFPTGGDYPLVVRGDAVLSRLLYLRDRRNLRLDEAALSLVEDAFTGRSGSAPEDDWMREWWHAWSCLDAVHLASGQRHHPEDVPEVLHPEWFAVDGVDGEAPGYGSADYREWLARHQGAAAGGYIGDPVNAQAAFAAAQRGLIAIFLVPLDGTWWGRTQHLLGVSPVVFDSEELLRSALDEFA